MVGRLRTAVIGVGRFGQHHARKLAALPASDLVAVVDRDPNRAAAVGAELGVPAETDYRELFGRVDAVSVAVPTSAHFEVAHGCLRAGVHVLLEKPMTADLTHADRLIALARRNGLVLQPGYLERFAVAAAGLDRLITRPLFIECHRIAPFQPRGLDISVVYDLMIHDIDTVLALVKAPLIAVDAVGAPVLSGHEDIANTRLRFADGCVANITASRISDKNERKMRVFQPDGYLSIDFLARRVTVIRRATAAPFAAAVHDFADEDALKAEIESFLAAVAGTRPPMVTGTDGRRALAAAERIEQSLRGHRAALADVDVAPAARGSARGANR